MRDQKRHDDLIEIAARTIAFTGLTDAAVPELVNDLMIEAVGLAGGWDGFDPNASPGTQNLPIADQVADAVALSPPSQREQLEQLVEMVRRLPPGRWVSDE
jgi:hypothetical protein